MDIFAKRLKKLREDRKITSKKFTQGYVAELIGVARPTYTAYENGTKQPPLETVDKIADVFGVTTDYLLGRSDTPSYTEKEDEEFRKAISDPDLKRWHSELPEEDEEDLKKLKMMWDIIKSDKNNTN